MGLSIRNFFHLATNRRSLRTKLMVALAAIAVIPLVLTNLITSQTTEKAMMLAVFEKNQLLAETIAEEVTAMLGEKIRMLKVAASNFDIRSMEASRQLPLLRDLSAQHPDLLIALTATPGGDLRARSDGAKNTRINYSDRSYFKEALRTGKTAVSDVLISKTTGKLGIALAEPVKMGDRILGMVIITVDLQKLIDRIAKTKIGQTGYTFVVNREGRILLHPDRSLVEGETHVADLAPVQAAVQERRGWAEYTYRGQKKLAGYSFVPLTGWGLVAQQPLEEAMAEVNAVKWANGVILLITLLVALFVILALANVLFKPIATLTAAAQRVAEGDLLARADVGSQDEIGTLASTFNLMTEQIRKREVALTEAHDELERRVIDRTAELATTNDKLRIEIDHRKKIEMRLRDLSEKDVLTSIYNRRKLFDFLELEFKKAKRYSRPLSLVMFDLDHFKDVNDRHGHDAGDVVLKNTAKQVSRLIREVDLFARYGGEEFMIICPELDIHGARAMAERIRNTLEHHTYPEIGAVTVSIGIAELASGESEPSFVRRVDEALYMAKENGRNRVEAG